MCCLSLSNLISVAYIVRESATRRHYIRALEDKNLSSRSKMLLHSVFLRSLRSRSLSDKTAPSSMSRMSRIVGATASFKSRRHVYCSVCSVVLNFSTDPFQSCAEYKHSLSVFTDTPTYADTTTLSHRRRFCGGFPWLQGYLIASQLEWCIDRCCFVYLRLTCGTRSLILCKLTS